MTTRQPALSSQKDEQQPSIFDNGGEFTHHTLLRDMLSHTTYFCDAYASWQKGGVKILTGGSDDGSPDPWASPK